LDWVHLKKKGFIAAAQPNILDRIGVDGEAFINYSTRFLKVFGSAVGAPSALIDLCARRQIKYLRGIHAARSVFGRQEKRLAA